MQPKSQFSSGNLAHKVSAPKSPTAQFEELNCSTQARQPRSQLSLGIQPTEPQRLSFEELNYSTQARLPKSQFSLGIQPAEPQRLSFEGQAAQEPVQPGIQPAEPRQLSFEELNYSTQARQPRSQFSSGIQPTEPQQHSFEELNRST